MPHSHCIYLASRFKTIDLTRQVSDLVTNAGHKVMSTWHLIGGDVDNMPAVRTPLPAKYQEAVAIRDIQQLKESDTIIVISKDCELTPGGMWVELGYAIGTGKNIIVFGPRINVFCHLPGIYWTEHMKNLLYFLK